MIIRIVFLAFITAFAPICLAYVAFAYIVFLFPYLFVIPYAILFWIIVLPVIAIQLCTYHAIKAVAHWWHQRREFWLLVFFVGFLLNAIWWGYFMGFYLSVIYWGAYENNLALSVIYVVFFSKTGLDWVDLNWASILVTVYSTSHLIAIRHQLLWSSRRDVRQ